MHISEKVQRLYSSPRNCYSHIYVNSSALSRSHPQPRLIARNENVVRYYRIRSTSPALKPLCMVGNIKLIYLVSLLTHYLRLINNLAITLVLIKLISSAIQFCTKNYLIFFYFKALFTFHLKIETTYIVNFSVYLQLIIEQDFMYY